MLLSGHDTIVCIVVSIIFCFALGNIIENINIFINPCKITAINNRICSERLGDLYLQQNVTINNDSYAVLDCGKIRNCETSPCNFYKVAVGETLYCYKDKHDIYHCSERWFAIQLIISFMILIVSGMFIFFLINTSEKQLYLRIANDLGEKKK